MILIMRCVSHLAFRRSVVLPPLVIILFLSCNDLGQFDIIFLEPVQNRRLVRHIAVQFLELFANWREKDEGSCRRMPCFVIVIPSCKNVHAELTGGLPCLAPIDWDQSVVHHSCDGAHVGSCPRLGNQSNSPHATTIPQVWNAHLQRSG